MKSTSDQRLMAARKSIIMQQQRIVTKKVKKLKKGVDI